MFNENLKERVELIEKDSGFSNLNTNEARIAYIFAKHVSRKTFEESFQERKYIVRYSLKSYEKAKEHYDRAYDEFVRISHEEEAENLGEDDFAEVLHNIAMAILFAPQETQINVLFNSYVLKLKVHLILNSTEKVINDYMQMASIHDNMDPSEQFEVQFDYIEDLIPNPIQQLIGERYLMRSLEDPEEMAKLRIDDRCVFVTHPERGRYMIAKRDIGINEVLLSERPQVFELNLQNIYLYCSFCLLELLNGFYPCFACIECVFCDRKCAERAWNGFHRYECGIIHYILNERFPNWLQGYRVLTSLDVDDINQLYDIFLADGQDFDLKEWILHCNNEVILKSDDANLCQYKGLSTFVEHSYKNSIKQKINDIFDAIEIALLIEEMNIFRHLTTDENFIKLVAMLVMHFNRCISNCFSFLVNDGEDIGQYIALVTTMINHSCVPNIDWEFIDGKMTCTSIANIKAGDEISDNYGAYATPETDEHPFHTFIERQRYLREEYNFVCDCIACKRDKTKARTIMKCRECKGTVYYGSINPQFTCIDCGRVEKTNYYFNQFKNIMKIRTDFKDSCERGFHTEESLRKSNELLKKMSEICDSASPDLLAMKQKFNSICNNGFQ